jgi:hypothetical protein
MKTTHQLLFVAAIYALASITSCTIDLMPKVTKCATDHYPEDTAQICSTYNLMKGKVWYADSILINGIDYTSAVLNSVGGYYRFYVDSVTGPWNIKDSQAVAFIDCGLGWQLWCAWHSVGGFRHDWPFAVADDPPSNFGIGEYIAPLPFCIRGGFYNIPSPDWQSPRHFRILSLTARRLKTQIEYNDSTVVNIFKVK